MTPSDFTKDLPKVFNGCSPRENGIIIDNGPDSSQLPNAPSYSEPERLVVLESGADDWSADPSSLSDDEDYNALKIDPNAVIGGSRGDDLADSQQPRLAKRQKHRLSGAMGVEETPVLDANLAPRQSVQIILEKTSKKGRYILTAEDPEIMGILRSSINREAGKVDPHKSRTRFRDLVFTRRFTTFDRQNPLSAESPFHGFFTLFWIAMGLLLVKVAMENWRTYGSMLGKAEIMHMMFDRDLMVLGIADGVMCGATIFGLGLQRLIEKGYLTWAGAGWVIQHIWQTFFLGAVIAWTYYREWPWTHTIFFVLHGLVFLMKQHSYAFYNGYLSQVYRRRHLLKQKLDQLEDMGPITSPLTQTSPVKGFPASSSAMDSPEIHRDSLKHRRQSLASKASTNLRDEESEIAAIAAAIDSGDALDEDQMKIFGRVIRTEIRSLNDELKGKCTSGTNCYPRNLTVANWADWTCLPTLVYELEYPRQDKINWWYVAEKTAATFGVIWCMIVISQAYIYPPVIETMRMKEAGLTLEERWRSFPWILSDMLFPLLLEQLLAWYVIWECSLNVLAELTRFADRGFYGQFWNSVAFDEYARDWNRPVHNFLLRHVYHSSISAFNLSKSTATFVTFFLSACVHELLMFCLFKKVRGYLFCMQLMQLPLVSLSRTKLLKGRSILGNALFWFGLFVGPSVLTSLYLIV